MSEMNIMWIGVAKLLLVLFGAILYSCGGRDDLHWYNHKWVRRFLAPIIVFGGSILFKWTLDMRLLAYLGVISYIIGFCMGYGKSSTLTKMFGQTISRIIVAIIVSSGVIALGIVYGRISTMALSISLSVLASPLLGRSGDHPAPQEELLLGLSYFLFVPFF